MITELEEKVKTKIFKFYFQFVAIGIEVYGFYLINIVEKKREDRNLNHQLLKIMK